MAIDSNLAKEIKARADIVDVISYYLNSVQKKGRRYAAVCPFHDDHDPSLQIDKEKQIFRCYVCGTGGDVFSFVQSYEKCSFFDAIKKVAEIIGYDDPRLHERVQVKKVDETLTPIYNCLTELQKFYAYGLTTEEGKIARDYLDKRHLSVEQREKFGLGYAFKDGKMVIQYLQQKGFSLKNIEGTGIALVQTTGMNDNNSGRLIFPIKDHNGQVVGFSARRLVDDDSAKYVNSPDTKAFTKSNVLYNYYLAKQTAKHDGFVYVVEGFMDVFALDSIGITSCVALMSTKLTNRHVEMLRNLGVEVRLCLDGDNPGQAAMMKIMTQLDEAHIPYRLVSVPLEVRDPDEILKQDGEDKLKAYVNTLVDPFNFALNYYKNISPLGSVDDRKKVINHFLPTIHALNSQLEKDDYIYKLSDATGFSAQAIRNALKEYAEKHRESNEPTYNVNIELDETPSINKVDRKMYRLDLAEFYFLRLMFLDKQAVDFYKENIRWFANEQYRTVANFIIERTDSENEVTYSNIINDIQISELPDSAALVDLVTKIGLMPTINYSEKLMNDTYEVILSERSRIHTRSSLKKALEGKSPQEQARLVATYLEQTKVRKSEK